MEEQDVLCCPQENMPGPDRRTRREAHLGALQRHTTGEEPVLGNGYDFWTMAGISSAMAVMDRFYSNEETENGECVVGRAPCRGGREQFVFEWMKSLYG